MEGDLVKRKIKWIELILGGRNKYKGMKFEHKIEDKASFPSCSDPDGDWKDWQCYIPKKTER